MVYRVLVVYRVLLASQYQQQQAAALPDGPAAAQEAQQHDDDPDGDHQVHPGQRLARDLEHRQR